MKIAVTGATSMIGCALIRECITNGTQVLAIVRKGTKRLERLPASPLVEIAYAGLDELDTVSGSGFDALYHFAWEGTMRAERDDPLMQERNIRSTLKAAELAVRLGCGQFVFAGSQAEYGRVEGVSDPDTVPRPETAYGMAKLAAGMLSKRYCEKNGLSHIWTRIFSVYGTMDNAGTMLDYAIDQFLKGETAQFSAGRQMWNYLFESDAGKLFYRLTERHAPTGIYCIAGKEAMPLRSYIEIMRDVYGEGAVCAFASDGDTVPLGIQADITKTVQAADYCPQVGFAEGISSVIAFKRAQKEQGKPL